MTDHAPSVQQRRSRFWLFAPTLILVVVAAAWTTAWFVIRDQTTRALDSWLAQEMALGRQWSCPNRTVGGYPFRIEVECDALSLQRPDFRISLGPVSSVAQVYRPRHIITSVSGPLAATDGRVTVTGNWRSLEASIRTSPEGLQRVSLVTEAATLTVKGLTPDEIAASASRVETHVRPDPQRGAREGAYDWSLQLAQAGVPLLDNLVGDADPIDLDLQLTATQVRDAAARAWPQELERWRQAGGRVEIAALSLIKGPRGVEAKGEISLDEAHRLQGQIDASAAGLETLLAKLFGAPSGLAGALLSGGMRQAPAAQIPPAPGQAQATKPALKPLPAIRLDGGRVRFGPISIPGIRLPPLY
ncbi:MAG TPA: DUF2125 domain-containing protein [Beijerinckiaceae bacterium]|nr:DUF2125 domain-containing protein [Beijerinckiaceae bacterium]